jgi:hypothetical protein
MSMSRHADLPGQVRHIERLKQSYGQMVRTQQGRIVFVVGDDGSGRDELLRAAVHDLARLKPSPTVLGGGFVDGTYVAWDQSGETPEKVISMLRDAGEAGSWLAGSWGQRAYRQLRLSRTCCQPARNLLRLRLAYSTGIHRHDTATSRAS